jgi:ribosomal peptide maturation radical SAM protein 1
LVSPPWPLYNRPSIQLGALKAFVAARFPEVAVDAHHLFLEVAGAVGYPLYQRLSERTWLAESVYAALLYPGRTARIADLFRREASGIRELRRADFEDLVSRIKAVSADWISRTDWGRYRLVGFTIVLCQLTASLYLIRRIKARAPALTVVVGGAAFNAASAPAALALFPEIDAVVCGEGELPLSHIVRHRVLGQCALADLPAAEGLTTRAPAAGGRSTGFDQIEDLDRLPTLDFDDYFRTLERIAPGKRFFPTLPVEFSRGCWWQRASGGCAFCNLNLQWRGYRAKSAARAASEVGHLVRRHKTLSLAVVDNVLPEHGAGEIFRAVAALKKDISLFAEIRATTPLSELEAMRAAGLRKVQIGIEALSTRLLRRLGKGTTAIQNLEIMKHCEGLGIASLSNLIAHFPGSGEEEVRETLRVMDFAAVFRPLKLVSFWLGLGSPVAQRAEDRGLTAVGNHPNWAVLFPRAVFRALPFTIQAYRGDRLRQRRLWRPVAARVRLWEKTYAALHHGPFPGPIISYRDGGDFMIIRERRVGEESHRHRLEGTSRRIYLFCSRHRRLKRICAQFPGLPQDKIEAFLKQMAARRLMFAEDGAYLSLAVPENGYPPGPGAGSNGDEPR